MKIKKNFSQIFIVVFTFLIYANTLGHQYALDDKLTFWKNEFVQNGISGISDILSYDTMAGMFGKTTKELEGGRYRPLSLVTFALEVEFFGKETTDISAKKSFIGNPFISHFTNVILYCISMLLLFKVLSKLFEKYNSDYWYLSIPFIATMLFAVHPLHTEIVANIKGRDEILSFLFAIAATNSAINYIDKNKKIELVNIGLYIFLSSMSKEIGLTFLAIIPVSIYFFRDVKFSKIFVSTIPVLAGVIAYLLIRHLVIGDQSELGATKLMNDPFINADYEQRYATVFYTLLLYVKLIIFPHPQTWDYYPFHIPLIGMTDWRAILGLLIYIVLIVVMFLGVRKKKIYSYGIFIYLATLSITSNIFFSIGAFMSERFVYVSLLGAAIIFAFVISENLSKKIVSKKHYKKTALFILIPVLLVFSIKTISRNRVWENNLTLFAHDLKVSKNSAKGNSSYASELYKLSEDAEAKGDTALRNKYLLEAIPYFEKSIEIYPGYSEALVRLGNIYYKVYGDYKKMFDYYIKTLQNDPLNADVWNNTNGVMLYNIDEPKYEKEVWLEFIKAVPERSQSYIRIGDLYYSSNIKDVDSAIYYYEKAIQLDPNNFDVLFNLGVSYGNKQVFSVAREYLVKASKIKDDAETLRYIGMTYGMENQDEKALEYFEKALLLDPTNDMIKQNIEIAKQRLVKQ